MLGSLLCNQIVNPEKGVKIIYYSLLKLKQYSPSKYLKHKKDWNEYASLNNSHRNHPNRIFYQKLFKLIDHSLHPMGHMPWIIWHLWKFLCIRNAGCRDNIITGIMTPIHSVSWLLLLNFIIWIIWLSAATQHSTKLILLPQTYYFHFKAAGSWESINENGCYAG